MEPTGIPTPIDQTTDAPIQDDAAKQRRKEALARVEELLAAMAASGSPASRRYSRNSSSLTTIRPWRTGMRT